MWAFGRCVRLHGGDSTDSRIEWREPSMFVFIQKLIKSATIAGRVHLRCRHCFVSIVIVVDGICYYSSLLSYQVATTSSQTSSCSPRLNHVPDEHWTSSRYSSHSWRRKMVSRAIGMCRWNLHMGNRWVDNQYLQISISAPSCLHVIELFFWLLSLSFI